MDNVTDNSKDSSEDSPAPTSTVARPDTSWSVDTGWGPSWEHVTEHDDGSTWEMYQDEGRYPPWV